MTQPAMTPAILDSIRDLEPSRNRQPLERLLLAVLQQAVLDYFSGNKQQQRDALRYFQHSVLYRLTLQFFDLPPDALPQGVQPDTIPGRPIRVPAAVAPVVPEATGQSMNMLEDLHLNGKTISLLTLMQLLKGNRLHVFLTVHFLHQPVTTADVATVSGISEDTVRRQMIELQQMGLLEAVETAEISKSWVISQRAAAIITSQTG
jgi:hypothetical protein